MASADPPDDAALAKMMLALSALGNVRTEFNETEFRKIVAELPWRT